MRNRNRTIELLAPAGSYETLCAVTEAGCDAVYIGGPRFGARAYADNPDGERLLQGIDYAHMRGVKVYLTVNTLLKNRELAELRDYLLPFYEAGLDAVIVQDPGVMKCIAEWFPELPIHVSTQMTVTQAEAVKLFPKSVTRIVPARELNLAEIAELADATDLELEIFAHGALCYSYSGQCLLSSLIGGRSGNRGRCAQPCRKQYRYEETAEGRADGKRAASGYLLSPKDQCLLPGLHELIETGIDSLKLEGRMKKAEYAAGVTGMYRKWLDRYEELGPQEYRRYLAENEDEMRTDIGALADLYNRGGFCGGYVFDTKGSEMMCTTRPNHTGVKVGTAEISGGTRPSAVLTLTGEVGAGDVLEIRTSGHFVCGDITIPKDMARFDASRPVAIRWDPSFGKIPKKADVYRMKNEALLEEIDEEFVTGRKPLPVCGTFRAAAGEPIRLTVTDEEGRACVTVAGDVPEEAKLRPTTGEDVLEKLRRTGGSGYAWEQLSADVADGLFVPVSKINELRREALEAYESAVLKTFRRSIPKAPETIYGSAPRSADGEDETVTVAGDDAVTLADAERQTERVAVCVCTKEQTEASVRYSVATDLWVDMEGEYEACFTILRTERKLGTAKPVRIGLVLPRVGKGERGRKAVAEAERLLSEEHIDTLIVRTPDQLARVETWRGRFPGLTVYTDSTLHLMNDAAAAFYEEHGADAGTLSPELRRSEISETMASSAWLTVYERTVLMISEQCPHRTAFGCGNPGSNPQGLLYDETAGAMPVRSVCRYCHSLLYNAHVTSLLTVYDEVRTKRPYGVRAVFSTETRRETERVLRALAAAMDGETVAEPIASVAYTRGHWKRGIL
ncbi:MAG: U32 family peptidase [Lachnospiraceae bacterium]|nr:U32 family peptidase [Lachnospiraceae bacterium]